MWVGGAPPDIHDVIHEIVGGSDRVAAIVGGSLVEEMLTRALRAFLRQDAVALKEAFDFNGPLGTFSAKISMGYVLGLYGKEVRRDLDLLRKVRNDFAHQLSATLQTQDIRNRVMAMEIVERYSEDGEAPKLDRPKPVPDSYLDWPSWIFIAGRKGALADPRERFIGELQALLWAISAVSHSSSVKIGKLG
jgi:hypothetical protein